MLDIVRQLGIDGQDEFWLLFIAFGQLQVLIEDIPDALVAFEANLNQWTETNLEVLQAVSEKSQTVDSLAQSTKELADILRTFVNSCNLLMQRLQVLEQHSQNSDAQQRRFMMQTETSLETSSRASQRYQNRIEQQLARLEARRGVPGAPDATAKLVIGLLVVCILLLCWLGWQQQQILEQFAAINNQAANVGLVAIDLHHNLAINYLSHLS